MNKWVNGHVVPMTAEEIAEMHRQQAEFERLEKHRPFTAEEVSRMVIEAKINDLAVDDNTALRMQDFYPAWQIGTDYTVGFRCQHDGKLFKCLTAHTAQDGWQPSTATASLWTEVNETHDGSADDPIPYAGNMALEDGKHYEQDGVIYLCIRDSGNPVYNALADLVDLYVQAV